MNRLIFLITFLFSFSVFSSTTPKVTDGFWKNTKESFTENIPWHVGAVALTPMLIYSGVDAKVHTAFKGTDHNWFLPGVAAGYLLPFAALPMYAEARRQKNNRLLGASYTIAHASIITLSTVSLLKSFTGRDPPDAESSRSPQKQSRDFNFGFLNRGIYDGWPSGHMATITSIASSMIHYYPEQTWIKYLGGAGMAYTMLLISAEHRGQFHWFSDGVAGGLMGWVIGRTVGKNIRENIEGTGSSEVKTSYDILPIVSPEKSGLQIVWTH